MASPTSDTRAHDEAPLLWSVREGVLRCVINRPGALNALTPELLFLLAEVVTAQASDPAVKVVTLAGAGSRAFSAGFDLKSLAEGSAKAHAGQPLERANDALLACPKPTIALVSGYCVGAGFDTAMSCDFRIATPDSSFFVPAIKIGTVYQPRAIEKFWRLLGPTTTKQLFVMGRRFSAEDAYRVGIVQQVVEVQEVDAAVAEWASISDKSMSAMMAHKKIIDAIDRTTDRGPAFWEPLDELRSKSVASPERKAAVASFVGHEKGES